MEIYNDIVDYLQESVDNGTLSFEDARIINDIAYEKYVNNYSSDLMTVEEALDLVEEIISIESTVDDNGTNNNTPITNSNVIEAKAKIKSKKKQVLKKVAAGLAIVAAITLLIRKTNDDTAKKELEAIRDELKKTCEEAEAFADGINVSTLNFKNANEVIDKYQKLDAYLDKVSKLLSKCRGQYNYSDYLDTHIKVNGKQSDIMHEMIKRGTNGQKDGNEYNRFIRKVFSIND